MASAIHAVDEGERHTERAEGGVAEGSDRRLGHRAHQPLGLGEEVVEPAAELRDLRSTHRGHRDGAAQRPANVTGCLRANATTPLRKSSVWPLAAIACASSSIWVSRLSWVDWWKSSLARPKARVGP